MSFAIQFGLRCTNTALAAWLAQAEMGTALHLHQQHQREALCTQSFESAGQDDTEKRKSLHCPPAYLCAQLCPPTALALGRVPLAKGASKEWLPPGRPLTRPLWLEPAPASPLKTHKPIKPSVLIGCDSSFCYLAVHY